MSKSPDPFDAFAERVRQAIKQHRGPFFTTNVSPEMLVGAYLSSFLDPVARQVHTCNCCRRFIEKFGGLVTVDDAGNLTPIVWDRVVAPGLAEPYHSATVKLYDIVAHATVDGVFLSSDEAWGIASNVDERPGKGGGTWTHFATPSPAVFRATTLSAGQKMAELREDFKLVRLALEEYPITIAEQMHRLFESGQLYRAEAATGRAKWFFELHQLLSGKTGNQVKALTWRAVATAPSGFSHLAASGSVVAPILEGIKKGWSFDQIKRTYEAMVNPTTFQRAQAAPTAGAIAQAEKVIAQLQSAGALERRFLRRDEVPENVLLWQPPHTLVGSAKHADPGRGVMAEDKRVFSHIKPKDAPATEVRPLSIPAPDMTFAKFMRDVLPGATSIEVMVPRSADRFMALVTAANPEAPHILQWDNPVSWAYGAGMDADFRRRVTDAGGQYEDVDIRCSLLWSNHNDLDLHCITPARAHIYYGDEQACTWGGFLDVDMNVRGETDKPVENIRWERARAPGGHYRFFVHNYRFHRMGGPSPFRIELEVEGEKFYFEATASPRGIETSTASEITVAEFTHVPGRKLTLRDIRTEARVVEPPVVSSATIGVEPGQWAKVTGIVPSPNTWGDKTTTHHGQHTFFLLDGATPPPGARGFYTETLVSDYRPIRSVLEAHMASVPVAGADQATACGIGMNNTTPWGITLRVNGNKVVNIDRWE